MPAMKAWNEFLDKYYPEANRADASVMYAYIVSQGLVHVLKACGDDLTRANIMKQAVENQGPQSRRLVAGGQGQHLGDRFCASLATAVDQVQGRHLGTLRRDSERRHRRLARRGCLAKYGSPCGPAAGAFCCEASSKMSITTPSKELR